jgi:hypothetical protein
VKHKFSILLCIMDDDTQDVYVNGIHCYRHQTELLNPSRLADKLSKDAVVGCLAHAANDVSVAVPVDKSIAERHGK